MISQQQTIIHIDWDGPYTLDQLKDLMDSKTEKGIYQVYGFHPVYGKDVLLYIGKTEVRHLVNAYFKRSGIEQTTMATLNSMLVDCQEAILPQMKFGCMKLIWLRGY